MDPGLKGRLNGEESGCRWNERLEAFTRPERHRNGGPREGRQELGSVVGVSWEFVQGGGVKKVVLNGRP